MKKSLNSYGIKKLLFSFLIAFIFFTFLFSKVKKSAGYKSVGLPKSTYNKIFRSILGREIKDSEYESVKDKSLDQLVDELLESSEYKNKIASFVQASFQFHLGRGVDPVGLTFWSTRFPLEIYTGIMESDEYKIKKGLNCISVTKVIDGDTIELEDGRKVRYIGIDAPEIAKEEKSDECFAREAKKRNEELVLNTCVFLEKDVSEKDPFGRSLFYVYNNDGTMINEYLVRFGFAIAKEYHPDTKHAEKLRDAENWAKKENLGLWKVCSSKYDCSSDIYNCSDFKTQKEAQAVFDYCFSMTGTDIHRIDRDGDGKACISLP